MAIELKQVNDFGIREWGYNPQGLSFGVVYQDKGGRIYTHWGIEPEDAEAIFRLAREESVESGMRYLKKKSQGTHIGSAADARVISAKRQQRKRLYTGLNQVSEGAFL